VHYLNVSKSSVHTESIESDRQSTSLHSGLRTLLTHEGAPKVDAAIHLFTVYSNGNLSSSAAAFIYGVSDKPLSWELSRPAKEYLNDSKNLEKRILEARVRTINGVKHAYDRAAHELASAIFSGRNATEQDRADEALNALKSFAKNSLKPPKLLVRATDMFEHDMFMPLGLLSAKGEYAVLEKKVNILLPLPIEDYGESGCIDKWVVAVSDALEGAEVTVPEEIRQDKSWLGESFEALRRYLTKKERSQKEMLLIVAHHSDGQLWYGENDFQLLADQIKRNYGNSTAAVLAMCKAGGVSSGSSHLIRRLNEFGLDAAIISPFPLDANYGKAFAIEFYRAVKEAQTSGRPDTLEQLFNAAVSATATKMENHTNPRVKGSIGDMGLELILVGNQTLRLCN